MERIGLDPGAEVGGYTIISPLGAGAMGAVYRAADADGNIVAFKVLHGHVAADPDTRERLNREISALRKVHHPAVSHLIDAESEASEMFIVTELVDGPTLESEIADRGPLGPVDLFELANQLANALEAVHAAGVIHRDLKPSNVLIGAEGPVLIDFGISHGLEDARMTSVGFVMGTPGYLAPELIDRGDPSPTTDWWGWAALLVFAATGRPPFGVRPLDVVIARAHSGDPDTEGLGPSTAAALRGALAADPAYRWSVQSVVSALRTAAQDGDPVVADVESGANGAELTTAYGVHSDAGSLAGGAGGTGTAIMPVSMLPQDNSSPPQSPGEYPYPPAPAPPASEPLPPSYLPGAIVDGYPAAPDGYAPPPSGPPLAFGGASGLAAGYGYQPPTVRRRPWLLLTLAAPIVLAGATFPTKTLLAVVLLVVIVRLVGTAHSTFHERRENRGVRGSDGVTAVLRLPWQLVRAVLGTIPSALVAASGVLVLCGPLWWLLRTDQILVGAAGGEGTGPNGENPPWVYAVLLGAATFVALMSLWFGPMTRPARHGARVILGIAAAEPIGATLVVVGALILSWVFLAFVLDTHIVDWAPLQEPPRFNP